MKIRVITALTIVFGSFLFTACEDTTNVDGLIQDSEMLDPDEDDDSPF